MPSVSYTPAPHEKPYFDALFQVADAGRKGSLAGGEAVAFFSRSKLPLDVLKNVWTIADQNPTNSSLDARKFYTALRLIQLAQNGVQGQGADLAAPSGANLKPVMFEGVSGVSVPLPQQQQAPPQQQQAPPQQQQTPPQQQQGGPPPTPPRPPMQQQQQPPAGASTALTTQDPYSLPPNEQARYEQLFPQYAKDGYVYGTEAVALFNKSGVPQSQLGAIWNMVDNPVDNRLDPLEFAMAMHLIVCVSKKNLPLPAALPISLKMLKSQQQAATQQQPPPVVQQPPGSPQVSTMSAPSPLNVPSQPIAQTVTNEGSVMSNLSGPPPIQRGGGMSISDAFEGLSTSSGGGGIGGGVMESTPAQDATLSPTEPKDASAAFAAAAAAASAAIGVQSERQVAAAPEPAPPAPAMQVAAHVAATPTPTIVSTKELAASYDQGDEHEELMKLKETLQKLQAENISLKASLGHMSDEEKAVQREISATVAEIGRLSSELTTLRAQVLAAKSALLEATADLKGHKDKEAKLRDLISDTQATKEALDEALDGVHDFQNEAEHREAPVVNSSVNEADLFGWDAAPAPAPAVENAAAPMVEAASSSDDEDAVEEVPIPQYQPEPTHEHDVPQVSYGTYGSGQASAPSHQRDASQASYGTYGSGQAPGPGHQRLPSYAMDGVMGGASMTSPLPFSDAPGASFAPQNVPASPSAAEVEQLKDQALKAEETAREAESTSRALAQQVDDLRKIADQAEAEAREKDTAATKKKGGFGRGKKKNMKEAEKAKQEAAQKRKEFMDMQGQLNTSQTLAMETRREADKLREAAEKAEMEAVAAQSRETHAAEIQHQTPANGGGSYGVPEQKHQSVAGMGQMNSGFGNGQPMGYGGGFNSNDDSGMPSPDQLQSAYPW